MAGGDRDYGDELPSASYGVVMAWGKG